ncbi:hypothetical protein E1162_17245 [Rhodobacteraceae bacterium RKSG542]|uniref:hypothetical protein n=1 Tax=Pseudovibrio flavus TaxID=2529854 RepID=UPI0012BB6E94|nr:hypothetical protein [Pseudovibrio flavus]MTI18990.1 hypothetical protein [Pseudovibrio flavus]
MTWTLTFAPFVSPLVLAVLGLLIAAICILLIASKIRGSLLRSLALFAILLALANPALLREEREPLDSVVVLVEDLSQSQQLNGRNETTKQASKALQETLDKLSGFEVRKVTLSSSPAMAQDGTNLFKSLQTALSDVAPERVAGAIMITDGQVHDVPPDGQAIGFDAPIHSLLAGKAGEYDRRLKVTTSPRFALVGSRQVVSLEYVDTKPAQGPPESAELTIRRDGKKVSSRRIYANTPFEIEVEIAHGGNNIFEFIIEADESEITHVNNRATATIDGVRENLRVLLVSGSPHAGERTWRNLLKSDASVDLVHFTILRPPEKQDGTPINQLSLIAFPTRELFSEKIEEFDLIIFDRYERRGVLPLIYFDNIARYVADGGAVLVASGPDYAKSTSLFQTPLGRILPAEPTGNILEAPYHPSLSKAGQRHPVTRNLQGADQTPPAWSRWFRLIDTKQLSGQAILNGPQGEPLLVLDRVKEGRVATLLSDHVWLWARGYEGGGPHGPLLRQLAHWLMQEPDLEEEGLRLEVRGSNIDLERQTLATQVDPVILTGPTGQQEIIELEETEPGLWKKTLETKEMGLYSATDGLYTALANVGPANPKEFIEVVSTPDKLQGLAEETGGKISRLLDADGTLQLPAITPMRQSNQYHGSNWIGLRQTEATLLTGINRYPLLIGLVGLGVLLGLLSLTWYREGR